MRSWRLLLPLVTLVVLLLSRIVLGQTGDGYDLSWSRVDGGGRTFSTGGGYTLGGTIGQPDAGEEMSSGNCTLAGGFWSGIEYLFRVFMPLIFKNYGP